MADRDLAEKISRMTDEEVDREIRELGGDPRAIGERGQALVDRLTRPNDHRLAAGLPPRQAYLTILRDAAKDDRKRAIIEEELGGKKPDDATEEDLARVVARLRGH